MNADNRTKRGQNKIRININNTRKPFQKTNKTNGFLKIIKKYGIIIKGTNIHKVAPNESYVAKMTKNAYAARGSDTAHYTNKRK